MDGHLRKTELYFNIFFFFHFLYLFWEAPATTALPYGQGGQEISSLLPMITPDCRCITQFVFTGHIMMTTLALSPWLHLD